MSAYKRDFHKSAKKSYRDKLRSSYRRGYDQGFADARGYDRAIGSYVSAGIGYYNGMKGYRKSENARRAVERSKPYKDRRG